MKNYLKIIIMIFFISCDNKKELITTSTDLGKLSKLINLRYAPHSTIYEFSPLGIENPRTDIGQRDYKLIALLNYDEEDFKKISAKLKENKIGERFLDSTQVKKWFPEDLKSGFKKEGNFFLLNNIYSADLFISEKSFFKYGFSYIGDNNKILLYMNTQ